ncbi:MAG TPA: ATP-binding protein [Candidatus Limnocylindrales bacterium]|nr:ATP-binding protein [Candidatus Limnocylindrales bacterium]
MLAPQFIGTGIKLRLAAFIVAIAGITALIAWTAQSAWRRAGEVRIHLTRVQLQSFQIADHIQQSILELNNHVVRYGLLRNESDWAHFQATSKALDEWIDERRGSENTPLELKIHDRINTNYDVYMAAAREIAAKVQTNSEVPLNLSAFAEFETQGQKMLKLGFELAEAHRQTMNSFLANSNKSLRYLRIVLVTSLGLLFLAVGGLAAVVYRELIAPLRTRLVANEAIIERQEKLASLGMLAAGVAHEIRNPLTAIKAWLFIQQKNLQPGTPEHSDAEIIAQEVNHLERIVKEVLLFARPSEPQLTIMPASEPLIQVQRLLAPQCEKKNIHLVYENSIDAKIRVDPTQIQQALINLVQNAAESIGQGGSVILRVKTGTRILCDRMTEVVVLEVADSGKGIAPAVEKRLFDPFFTTKDSGTGLGLSITARIIEKHGGALQYQTQVNKGTTFGVVLPRAA